MALIYALFLSQGQRAMQHRYDCIVTGQTKLMIIPLTVVVPAMQSTSGPFVKRMFAQMSPEIVASLNALYVYACTAQGKSAVRESAAARFCIRFAARDKDYHITEAD